MSAESAAERALASALDDVYAERNALALAFAKLAAAMGWTVGHAKDPAEPDWPVLLIDTPHGQVSWHIKADQLPTGMPEYPGEWDGHDTPTKYVRLAQLVAGATPPLGVDLEHAIGVAFLRRVAVQHNGDRDDDGAEAGEALFDVLEIGYRIEDVDPDRVKALGRVATAAGPPVR